MTNPVDGVKRWLFRVAVAKAIKRAIPWLISMAVVGVGKLNSSAGASGIQVSVDEAALTAAVAGALAVFQNWVKVKFSVTWL